jgi:hypothetical protein
MDNDILINQARQLYVVLQTKQTPSARIERLLTIAYWRYQRRLNRCVLCYQYRSYDCIREPGKKRIPCARRRPTVAPISDQQLIDA